VIITARDPDYLLSAGLELDGSIGAFDATDFDRLGNRLRPHYVPRSPTTSAIATAARTGFLRLGVAVPDNVGRQRQIVGL